MNTSSRWWVYSSRGLLEGGRDGGCSVLHGDSKMDTYTNRIAIHLERSHLQKGLVCDWALFFFKLFAADALGSR